MTQKLHTSALNVLITLFAFSSFTAVFADSLYVLLYCTVREFHYIIKPFLSLFWFLSSALFIDISSHVPNLFFNFFGAKKKENVCKKQACLGTNKGLSSAQDGDWSTLQSNWSWEIFVTVCKLLSSTKDSGFFGRYFCLFPYSLLTEQQCYLMCVLDELVSLRESSLTCSLSNKAFSLSLSFFLYRSPSVSGLLFCSISNKFLLSYLNLSVYRCLWF